VQSTIFSNDLAMLTPRCPHHGERSREAPSIFVLEALEYPAATLCNLFLLDASVFVLEKSSLSADSPLRIRMSLFFRRTWRNRKRVCLG